MAISTASMVARRRVGQAFKEVRLAAGVSQAEAARAVGRKTVDRISQIERGKSWPTREEFAALVKLYRLDPVEGMRLKTMLEEGQAIRGNWWTGFEDEFPPSLIEFIAYEDTAQRIVTLSGSVIPGILQTAEYAHAVSEVILRHTASPDMRSRSVDIRRKRREILDRENAPILEAIIGEGAIRQQMGGRKVMAGQLDALMRDAERRNVVIRVIPSTAPATVAYSFHCFYFSGTDERPLIAFDVMHGQTFRKNPADVRSVRGYIDVIREVSMSPLDSLDLMRTIRKEMDRA
ncbi:helix-turn-helix transcriptional regulator [Streptomyces roseifaciens]